MLSDFQKKKLKNNFKIIDVNKDGLLSRDDLSKHGVKYADLIKAPQQEFINQELKWWNKIYECLGMKEDRPITQDEFIQVFEMVLTNSCFIPIYLWEFLELIWKSLSLKKTDFLEFKNFIGVMVSNKEDDAREVFALLDTEKKKKLSIYELYGYWLNFFYSNNQECPSKWVFGKFE